MINFFKFLVPGLAASLIGLISLPAQAIAFAPPPLTLFFSGNCEDCASLSNPLNHRITARLVLQNYIQNNPINSINFVSFSYDGSDRLPAYSILPSSLLSVSGNIPFALPGPLEFHVTGANNYFDLSVLGRWDTGVARPTSADTGGSGTLSPNAVPEPATMLLMGAALAAAGLARRRRQR